LSVWKIRREGRREGGVDEWVYEGGNTGREVVSRLCCCWVIEVQEVNGIFFKPLDKDKGKAHATT
jgi:hypothetical protein